MNIRHSPAHILKKCYDTDRHEMFWQMPDWTYQAVAQLILKQSHGKYLT